MSPILYALVGVVVVMLALVVERPNRDEMESVMFTLVILFLWPLAVPYFLFVVLPLRKRAKRKMEKRNAEIKLRREAGKDA